ncbi:hypothetical protein ABZ208_36820 [Streptomyces sp. NPDC006208]|uniref:hypothetical protein n=1 Tax=Streptomyces sp. NPDC006208 TaxID=3156734 RepID=UPI0033A9F984
MADAPNEQATTSPDASSTSSLAATAPQAGTVATSATAYHQSFTLDWLGNRATMTEHDPADAAKNISYTYRGTGLRPGYLNLRSFFGSSGSIRPHMSSGTIHGEAPRDPDNTQPAERTRPPGPIHLIEPLPS